MKKTLTDPAVRPGEPWSALTPIPVLSIHTKSIVVTMAEEQGENYRGTTHKYP